MVVVTVVVILVVVYCLAMAKLLIAVILAVREHTETLRIKIFFN